MAIFENSLAEFVLESHQRAVEMTLRFVPGFYVPVFTHTQMIHQAIAINKTFSCGTEGKFEYKWINRS